MKNRTRVLVLFICAVCAWNFGALTCRGNRFDGVVMAKNAPQAIVEVCEEVNADIPAINTAIFEYFDEIPLSYDEQAALTEACNRFSVDRALLLGLIEQETRFNNITGDGGHSIGYCQIQPRWWSGLMQEIGANDLNDPRDNFMTACAIIKTLCGKYGDTELALTAYNTGKPGQSKYATCVLEYTAKWSEVLYG